MKRCGEDKSFYSKLKTRMKKETLSFCFFFFIVIGIAFFSKSYALFQKQIKTADVNLKVGELEYKIECRECTDSQIELLPNSSKTIEIQLISKNPIDSKFELYYKIVFPDEYQLANQVDAGYLKTSESPSYGVIQSNEEKNLQLIFNNYGNQTVKIEIGIKAGLVHNELILEEGEYSLKEEDFQKHYVYEYTDDYQTFTAPIAGTYKIELWGAGSADSYENIFLHNKGGYVGGEILLSFDERLYIYVGQRTQGCTPYNTCTGLAWNGGGEGGYFTMPNYPARYPGGGGATDIRLVNGAWNDPVSLRSRIMVAGGSGVGYTGNSSAGGLVGYTGSDYNNGTGGTQTSGGVSDSESGGFGYGGKGRILDPHGAYENVGFGGGSGYYGGGGGLGGPSVSSSTRNGSGGGGSSFISGHAGCIAIKSEDDQTPKVSTYSKLEDSYHYSGKIFTNTVMIDGKGYNWTTEIGEKIDMPTHDLTSTMSGNVKDGYARITYLEK